MKIWVLTVLFVLNLTSIRGARMPKYNILGLHFDFLKNEANFVVGRKQAIFEVMGSDTRADEAGSNPSGPPGPKTGQLWSLEGGHFSELEMRRPLSVENRWAAPPGWRPLRYQFLVPTVRPLPSPLDLNVPGRGDK